MHLFIRILTICSCELNYCSAELRKKRLAEQAAVSASSSKSCSGDSKSAENADEDEDSAGDTDDSSSSAFGSSASDQFPGVTILEALSATGVLVSSHINPTS